MTSVGRAVGAEDVSKSGDVVGSVRDERGAVELREGDIYFWHWSDAEREKRLKYNNGSYQLTYWCMSQKAIVRNGRLIDTYWSDMSSERAVDPQRVVLDYKGNEATLKKISPWEADYYEPEDVVDMRHANSSRDVVYVKPSAERSKDRMIELLKYQRERCESAIRSANWNIEKIDEALAQAQRGELENLYVPCVS